MRVLLVALWLLSTTMEKQDESNPAQCLESCSIQLVGYILKQKVRNHNSPKTHDMSFSVLHTLHQSLCQIYRIHKGLAKILNTDVINTTYIISYVCSINMFWLHRRAFPSSRFVGTFTGNSFKWHLAFSSYCCWIWLDAFYFKESPIIDLKSIQLKD